MNPTTIPVLFISLRLTQLRGAGSSRLSFVLIRKVIQKLTGKQVFLGKHQDLLCEYRMLDSWKRERKLEGVTTLYHEVMYR